MAVEEKVELNPDNQKTVDIEQAMARLGEFANDTPLAYLRFFWQHDYKGETTIGDWLWDGPGECSYSPSDEEMKRWAEGKLFKDKPLNNFNRFLYKAWDEWGSNINDWDEGEEKEQRLRRYMVEAACFLGFYLHLLEILLLRALVIVQEQSSQTLTADQATRIEDLCKEWLNAYELGQDYILTGQLFKEMVLKQIAW